MTPVVRLSGCSVVRPFGERPNDRAPGQPAHSPPAAMRRHIAMLLFIAVLAAVANTQPRDLGTLSFPTSGPPAAQAAFIRGVVLLHNFEYDEAIEAFRDAQRQAPGFAMAY